MIVFMLVEHAIRSCELTGVNMQSKDGKKSKKDDDKDKKKSSRRDKVCEATAMPHPCMAVTERRNICLLIMATKLVYAYNIYPEHGGVPQHSH